MIGNNMYMSCCEHGKGKSLCEYGKGNGLNEYYPPESHIECCCKPSMKKALELLSCDGIRENVNFDAFAFITDFYVVGSPLVFLSLLPATKKDNLSAALDATLNKLPGCSCDTLDITGRALYPIPLPIDDLTGILTSIINILESLAIPLLQPLITLLNALLALGDEVLDSIIAILLDLFTTLPNVDLASLCQLKAVAFQTIEPTDASVSLYKIVRSRLKCLLDNGCKKDDCNPKCEDCCCNEGILKEVAGANITGTVTLTAGSLALQDVEVIGNKDNVIILGNEPEGKFYLVCADAVSLIG
ncbi:CotA family spore coat protein [Paraclostridium sordellii]|uniref:CotA family spore coat protein n=1 Tax=Paraclostridium sordellii TaxID=1505 RepID=UPI00189C2886|nr:CotA family spore coat protein [Paeniclostridium sordellii]